MSAQEHRSAISHIWLEKAYVTLEEASILLSMNKPVGAVNRLYYSLFYAVSAALAIDGKEYGKHSAVRSALHREFVNTGRIPETLGDLYDELFEDRHEGDYMPSTDFSSTDLNEILLNAKAFIETFNTLIHDHKTDSP